MPYEYDPRLTPDEFDRLNRALDFLAGIAEAGASDKRDGELGLMTVIEVTGLDTALGLPYDYGIAELDQRVAELRHALLRAQKTG